MPKLFGNSLISILVATVAFYMFGFLWYGFLFSETWMHLTGITEVEAAQMQERLGAMMFVWGLMISLGQVLGMAVILNLAKAVSVFNSIKIAVLIAVLIVLPVLNYGALYEGTSIHLVGIDFLHLLIGYSIIATILSAFKGKKGNI